MAILMDAIIVAILLLNIIIGYKRGLVNAVVSIVAFLIAIIATLILYKPISNIIINNTQIDDKIREVIIHNNTKEDTDEKTEEPVGIQKYIVTQMEKTASDSKEYAMEAVADTISTQAIRILTAIILFIAIRVIISILKFLTNSIANLPILKQFNELGGVLYGLIKGLIIIYVILTILFFIVSINGNGIISNAIQNSYITKFLYENNIIVNYCVLGKNLL